VLKWLGAASSRRILRSASVRAKVFAGARHERSIQREHYS
jgi:hypothetical protein